MLFIGSRFSDKLKIQGSFGILGILTICFPIVAVLYPIDAFWTGFILIALQGAMNGAMTTAVFGMAAFLPPKYMGSIMLGQGLAGVSCNILKVILLSILGNDLTTISIIFYSFGALFFFTCAFLYSVLIKNPFYIHHKALVA
jgi:hypothetical protein